MGLFEKLKYFFIEKLLLGWIKGGLDKIPGDGKKTVVGLILFVGSVVLDYYTNGQLTGYGAMLLQFVSSLLVSLQAIPHDPVEQGAMTAMLVGLIHKGLKWLDAKFSDKEEEEALPDSPETPS